jgi:hypothetical protein
MNILLCIAEAASLFWSADRDYIVAKEVAAITTDAKIMIVDINKPDLVPVSCDMAWGFIDKYMIKAMDAQGIKVQTVLYGKCWKDACTCPSQKIVCAKAIE